MDGAGRFQLLASAACLWVENALVPVLELLSANFYRVDQDEGEEEGQYDDNSPNYNLHFFKNL